MNEETITYFAQTDARSKRVNFGIKAKDRTKHVYVIGKTGMGKSTLLENMAVQDIKNGEGMAFIDPHGKSADLLLEYVPPERIKDVLYFAPFDTEYPISFNVLESVDPDKRHLVVSGLMSTFKKIWADAWSSRMEYILTNTLLALLEYPGATLLGVNRMLAEKDFRKDVIDHVTDISVKNYWTKEFANYTERTAAEAVPAIQNKIGQFTANALIRNMLGQPKSSFDIREMMDDRKIIIINLSKGRIGESNANLLGGMLITKIYLAALSRADVPERVLRTLPNFYLYVDEFQSFANESFADILSEARKYKLNLTIAHQYIEQMEEEVRAAVFGNVGTMIIFRVGAYDAEVLEKEFAPVFTAEDIVNLGVYQIYLKLMIDGISSAPFSARTLPAIAVPEISNAAAVIAASRAQFATNRAAVEETIVKWHEPMGKKVAPVSLSASVPYNPPKPMKTVVPVSIQKPIMSRPALPPQPVQKPFVAPTVTAPVVPVSLSSLSKNQTHSPVSPQNNQKISTAKNVNDLKNALAAIIGTEKKTTPLPIDAKVKNLSAEVPKEVLENILKM
jgi:energy-coupling factor transporter ATP-binding protein EcfA2